MKNILAENMLRFGVKNLSKSATNKVKMLAEAPAAGDAEPVAQPGIPTPAAPKTATKVEPQDVPGTKFRFVVLNANQGAGYDMYAKQPLVTIRSGEINIYKWTGSKTNRVRINSKFVILEEVSQTDESASRVNSSFSIADIMRHIPATIQVVDNIKTWLGEDLTNVLTMLVWVSNNHTKNAGCINSIIFQLQKVNNTSFGGKQGYYNKLKSDKQYNSFMVKGTNTEWTAAMAVVPKKR